jgi:hypothetical protein
MKNAKIIQIVALPDTGKYERVVIALTEAGQIFKLPLLTDDRGEWIEIPTKGFVHRTGNLI